MSKIKILNDRQIEYADVIYHTTKTKFGFWDRIKIMLGKNAVTISEIYSKHEDAKIVGSEAKTYVERLIQKESVGMTDIHYIKSKTK